MGFTRPLVLLIAASAVACQSIQDTLDNADYERHRMSSLRVSPLDEEVLIYEVQTDMTYPKRGAAAEAKRMEWLEEWLEKYGYCGAGYEIADRKELGPGDISFRDADIRYEVVCVVPDAAQVQP